jgi:hypothetical protein
MNCCLPAPARETAAGEPTGRMSYPAKIARFRGQTTHRRTPSRLYASKIDEVALWFLGSGLRGPFSLCRLGESFLLKGLQGKRAEGMPLRRQALDVAVGQELIMSRVRQDF